MSNEIVQDIFQTMNTVLLWENTGIYRLAGTEAMTHWWYVYPAGKKKIDP